MPGVDLPVRTAFAVVLAVAVVAGAGLWWASGSPATPDAVDRGGTPGAVGLQATPDGNAIRIDSCTAISEPGRYVLARDLVDRNASTCIAIRSSDGNVVVSNAVSDSSDTAILLISSDDNRVVDNVGSGNARGVSVVRSRGNVVENNSVG